MGEALLSSYMLTPMFKMPQTQAQQGVLAVLQPLDRILTQLIRLGMNCFPTSGSSARTERPSIRSAVDHVTISRLLSKSYMENPRVRQHQL
jgi:hypothetical protein